MSGASYGVCLMPNEYPGACGLLTLTFLSIIIYLNLILINLLNRRSYII